LSTLSSSWTIAVGKPTLLSYGICRVHIFSAANLFGDGPVTVTVTPGGTFTPENRVIAVEYSGLDPTSPLDRTAQLQTPVSSSPLTFGSGTTASTAYANELLTSVGISCLGLPSTVSWADNSGFATRAEETDSLSYMPGIAADKIVNAIGTFSDTWTVTYSGNNMPMLDVIAIFH
jgi:hypothetical protein